jgi:hypothetical protein
MTDVTLSPWLAYLLARLWVILKASWKFLAGGAGFLLLVQLLKRYRYGSYSVSVGLPFNIGSRTYDTTPWDRVVAWKLYVQLATRKAALPFDESFDLISDVYDSLFSLFGITRELLLGLPPHEFEREGGVAPLLLRVINDGLRPHLTRWQADFRVWWDVALAATDNRGKSPQEVQRTYPHYSELVIDLKRTNTELSKLADELLTIARAPKQKPTRPEKVLPLPPTPQSAPEEPSTDDYLIESNGTVVVIKSVRATERGEGPKPHKGARLAFKTKHETADFVRASEAEGFRFEGKEFLVDV